MAIRALPAKAGFKFGCDPELFVLNDKGVAVTAEGLIPGTKDDPHVVKYGAVQVDGMAAEFNIDPVDNFKDFNRNINAVLGQLKDMLPAGYSLSCVPAMTFSQESWDAAPDHAKILGCNPDFNAWTGQSNPPPNDPSNPLLRTASGHIHIGWRDEGDLDLSHLNNCCDLVKQLDWYLGGWSLMHDPDPTRRNLYGKAGACRYKEYGVEYRVLSNFWIDDLPKRLTVWNRLQTAINDMATRFLPDKALGGYNAALIDSIDSSKLNPAIAQQHRYPVLTLSR